MTKKDYVLIASAVKKSFELRDEARDLEAQTFAIKCVAHQMAGKFIVDNPRFDHFRFLEACGL